MYGSCAVHSIQATTGGDASFNTQSQVEMTHSEELERLVSHVEIYPLESGLNCLAGTCPAWVHLDD